MHDQINITFITGNQNKANQVAQWLGTHVSHKKISLDELQSLDIRKIVEHKARQAYGILKSPVLIEDVSLTFRALGRLPGPFIKWFIEELDHAGLVRLLDGHGDRSADAVCCYGYYDGRELHLFEGEISGSIADSPKGNSGFGFDPIFIPGGYKITRAEMAEEDYAKTSPRKFALDKLKLFWDKPG